MSYFLMTSGQWPPFSISRLSREAFSIVKLPGQYIWVLPLTFQVFTVAEWLTHSPAMLEVTGSRPTVGGNAEVYFSKRYSRGLSSCDPLCQW
jgi:hypothetical protein